jgi:hypothetical protein
MVEGSQSDYLSWKFDPVEMTVPVGSTVVWHNNGSQPHTATAEDKSFASPYLNNGQEFSYKFTAPGDFKYYCEPHRAWMTGTVHVVGAATPTTATTATTQPGSGATTTTAAGAQASTTTTAKGATTSSSSTTTTAAVAGGATTTTVAPAVTPTSAPESTASTTTTTAAGKTEEGAEAAHKHSNNNNKSSPVGIAFASVATLLLAAVSLKLLASKP